MPPIILDYLPLCNSARIVYPLEGDIYRAAPGVEGRYSTVALRAAGGTGSRVRWFVNGHAQREGRWPLVPGFHRIEARSARGEGSEVTIRVE